MPAVPFPKDTETWLRETKLGGCGCPVTAPALQSLAHLLMPRQSFIILNRERGGSTETAFVSFLGSLGVRMQFFMSLQCGRDRPIPCRNDWTTFCSHRQWRLSAPSAHPGKIGPPHLCEGAQGGRGVPERQQEAGGPGPARGFCSAEERWGVSQRGFWDSTMQNPETQTHREPRQLFLFPPPLCLWA